MLTKELSCRAACEKYGLGWHTLKKILAHDEPPGYRLSQPRQKRKLAPFLPIIHQILEDDRQAPKKQRHTAKRIFERLRMEHGYQGGQTVVKDAVRAWKLSHQEVFLPLSHPPGEAQVDFGEATIRLAGQEAKVALFVMTLPYSGAIFIQAFPRECTETFLEGHRQAFELFGGMPKRISYDNSAIAVSGFEQGRRSHDRIRKRDQGKALAGKSTLNRLELTPVRADGDSRYKKIVAHTGRMQDFFVQAFLQQHRQPPSRIVLDLDTTNDPIHGHQLGRFFHGYYDEYYFLPLYIFCGDHPLCALLRPADIDGAAGALKQLARIVALIRQRWPNVEIVIRADSGFCRDPILSWCEANHVHYLIGLAKNKRLSKIIGGELQQAKQTFESTGLAARVFKDFIYRTHRSWSRERRVIGKAEHLAKGANPRFVVTSLPTEGFEAQTLYEQEYCGRGEMENRIKEQQLMLFADRTSCETMRANQIRLCLSTVAYILMRAIREFGLQGTELAEAQCETIRRKLLKIGAVIKVSVRRIVLSLSESYPFQDLFTQVHQALHSLRAPPPIAIDSA